MKRILVVDDALTVRLFYRSLLEATHVVDEAVNGIEAMEKALAAPYDLYIVDVNMPKMDGYSFLRALRAEALPQAPAIMASTEAAAADRKQAWTAGANLYLTKPVAPAVLRAGVAVLLGETRA